MVAAFVATLVIAREVGDPWAYAAAALTFVALGRWLVILLRRGAREPDRPMHPWVREIYGLFDRFWWASLMGMAALVAAILYYETVGS